MRIRIERVDGNDVLAATSVGLLSGLWHSDEMKPCIGRAFDVEVDIDIAWEKISKTTLIAGGIYDVHTTMKDVIFQGMIEDVEDDMVCFRLSHDCLIMLSADKASCLKNEWYELSVDNFLIRITPFGEE